MKILIAMIAVFFLIGCGSDSRQSFEVDHSYSLHGKEWGRSVDIDEFTPKSNRKKSCVMTSTTNIF